MGQQPQLRTKAFLHRIPKRQSFSKKVQCGGKASLIALDESYAITAEVAGFHSAFLPAFFS